MRANYQTNIVILRLIWISSGYSSIECLLCEQAFCKPPLQCFPSGWTKQPVTWQLWSGPFAVWSTINLERFKLLFNRQLRVLPWSVRQWIQVSQSPESQKELAHWLNTELHHLATWGRSRPKLLTIPPIFCKVPKIVVISTKSAGQFLGGNFYGSFHFPIRDISPS